MTQINPHMLWPQHFSQILLHFDLLVTKMCGWHQICCKRNPFLLDATPGCIHQTTSKWTLCALSPLSSTLPASLTSNCCEEFASRCQRSFGIHDDTTNVWAGVCMLVMCLYWKELFPQVIIFKKIIYLFWTWHIGLLQHRTCTTGWGAQWNCMRWPRIASWRKGWWVDFLQRLWEKPIW